MLQRPWMIALLAAGAVLLLALAAAWLSPAPPRGGAAPWDVQLQGNQVQAFGLRLPGTTLAQVQARYGPDLVLALVERRQQPLALEGFVERVDAGGVLGRLVLVFDATPAQLQAWRVASPRHARAGADTLRHELADGDRRSAAGAALLKIVFLPQARLSPQSIEQRFGAAPLREALPEGGERWVWPDRGLQWQRDGDGRAVLEVQAPQAFRTAPPS